MIPYAPYLAIVVPIFMGIFLIASTRLVREKAMVKFLEKYAGEISAISSTVPLIAILSMSTDVLKETRIIEATPWIPSLNIYFGFLVDQVSISLGLIMAVVGFLVCLYSIDYMRDEPMIRGYYGCLLIFLASMIGVVFSDDLIQLYIFWEMMLLPSYFLMAYWGTSERRLEIGFKYFIFTHIGAISMLLGILATYVFTGTLVLVELPTKTYLIPPSMVVVISILFFIGFYVKMAVFPVHTWLPDAHAEAPTPISAMLSGLMIKCGSYGIARVIVSSFQTIGWIASDFLMILAVVTMVYGGFMAIAQTDIKRFLAYSSISQMGYIAFGLATESRLGVSGSLFHMVNHAIGKSLLFLAAGVIIHQTGTRDITKMGGLAQRMPITTVTCLVGALSLSGIPPLNGFWSEWLIFAGGLSADKIVITIFAVLSTVLTAGYYLWFSWRVFFGPLPEGLKNAKDPPWGQRLPLVLLAVMAFLIGVYPESFLSYITRGVENILGLGVPR
jgi:NADH-quinone oxidoreductase subunit M